MLVKEWFNSVMNFDQYLGTYMYCSMLSHDGTEVACAPCATE